MFIHNLSIENFKGIKQEKIEFNKINLFEGDTGNCKTGFLEALVLLLTNYVADQSKMSEYISWGKKSFKIAFEFQHKQSEYSYEIECNFKGTERLLIDKTNNNEWHNSDAVKYITENIIEPKVTLYSSVSMQQQVANLLFDTPASRLQKLKQVFKIDNIDKICDNLKEEYRKKEIDVEKTKSEILILESQKYEVQPELELPKITEEQIDLQIESLKKEKESYSLKIKEKEETNIKLLELYKNKQEVEKKLFQIDSREQVRQETFNQITNLENQITELKIGRKPVCQVTDEQINNKRQEYSNTQSEIKVLENKITNLKSGRSDIPEVIEKEKIILNIFSDIKILEKSISLAEVGKCSNCGQDYKEDPQKLKDEKKNKEEKIVELKNEIKVINDSAIKGIEVVISEFKNQLLKLEQEGKELQQIKDTFQKVISEYESKVKLKEQINLQLETLKNKYKENEQLKDKISKIEGENLIKEIDNMILSLKQKLEEHKTLFFDETLLEKLFIQKSEVQKIKNEIELIKKNNEKILLQKKENQNLVVEKKKSIEQINTQNQIIKETQLYLSKDFSAYLINNGTEFIKETMNKFFLQVYSGKYQVSFKNDGKGISFFYTEGNAETGEHNVVLLSGFEKALFSVSFRYALSCLQPDVGVFIGDEIDSDSSEEKSIKLFSSLLEQTNLNQFFIITHNEGAKEYLSQLEGVNVFEVVDGEIK